MYIALVSGFITLGWLSLPVVAHILGYRNDKKSFSHEVAKERFIKGIKFNWVRNALFVIVGSTATLLIIGILYLACVGAIQLWNH